MRSNSLSHNYPFPLELTQCKWPVLVSLHTDIPISLLTPLLKILPNWELNIWALRHKPHLKYRPDPFRPHYVLWCCVEEDSMSCISFFGALTFNRERNCDHLYSQEGAACRKDMMGCCMLGKGISGQPFRLCLVPHGLTAVISGDSFATTSSLLLGYSSSISKTSTGTLWKIPNSKAFWDMLNRLYKVSQAITFCRMS